MNYKEVIEKVEGIKKGSFAKIHYKTSHSVKGIIIEKETQATVRFGCEYANLQVNENRKTGKLEYGKWLENEYTYIIERDVVEGDKTFKKHYLRCYPFEGSKIVCKYFKDGKEITEEQAIEIGYKVKPHPVVFNITVDNIISIGW